MIEELNKLFAPLINDDEGYHQFLELISIKKIKDTLFDINFLAKVHTLDNKIDIRWNGCRVDIKPILRELKLEILTGNNKNIDIFEDLQKNNPSINIEEITGKNGSERLNEVRLEYLMSSSKI